jgi:hypothetical protein
VGPTGQAAVSGDHPSAGCPVPGNEGLSWIWSCAAGAYVRPGCGHRIVHRTTSSSLGNGQGWHRSQRSTRPRLGWLFWFAAGIVRISPCLMPISPLLRQIRQFSMTQSMRLRRRRKELGVGYALPLVPPGRDTKTAPRGLEDVGAESRFRNINPVPVIEPVKSCRRSRCGEFHRPTTQ